MSDLAQFLLDRISEDEAVAKSTPFARTWWPNVRLSYTGIWAAGGPGGMGRSVGRATTPENAEHILRWDPARVLAECAAKRRIVEEHKTIASAYPGTTIETDPCCATCSAGGEYPGEFPCPTLRLLALPYADHPDYRHEWRP